MGENGGRSLRGIEEHGYVPRNISLTPSIDARLEKYRKAEDRPRSWVVQKALDEWLKKRGY